MKIKFLGATQQVTGSSYLLEVGGLRIIVDCGLYQEREYISRNWEAFPVSAEQIDYVILTHVHLDHSGLADRDDLTKWLGFFKSPPKRLFITHGEKKAAFSIANEVKEKFRWPVSVPEYLQEWDLD